MKTYTAIQAELEGVRLAFFQLLHDIPERDWDRSLPGEGWTPRQEMAHITQIMRLLPVGIGRAAAERRRTPLAFVPERLRRWVNGFIVIPITYRSATRASIGEAYEKAHHALLDLLASLPEDAWGKGAAFPTKFRTVEEMAHRPAEHFAEHNAHLRRVLGI